MPSPRPASRSSATAPSAPDILAIEQSADAAKIVAWLRAEEPKFVEWQMKLASIPAPPFGESTRGKWLQERFVELGLADVHIDEVGNVFGLRPGKSKDRNARNHVAISAHIDTVFPAGTPLDIRRSGSRLLGPGVSDNGAGVVAMLAIAGGLQSAKINHDAPILFIGNVGEEGEGDLRGMRHIFSKSPYRDAIRYSLILDGAGADTIVAEALGSRRFEITVRGPGGHSWGDFGAPNPIVALANAIHAFSQKPLPSSPKTTLNVGVIRGGTSVNSIPESASMRVDIRSASSEEIRRLEEGLRKAVDEAISNSTSAGAASGNGSRTAGKLTSEITLIGDRPAGDLSESSRMLQAIRAVDEHLGNTAQVQRASTDANVPLSLGREALALGGGGTGGGAHTLQEWFDCKGRDLGLKRILLATLALAAEE
jgi:tripeptide aminopeptidase